MAKEDQDKGTKKYRLRYDKLWEAYSSWRTRYTDIRDNMLPYHGAYLTGRETDKNPGARKDQKIINGSATDALRIIAAGLQGGLTSPARPWFALTIENKDLKEFGPVRNWLSDVRDLLLMIFAKSNFYGSMHGLYKELAAFGTAVMLMEEDFTTGMRCRPFTIGEFMLEQDSTYRPNALFRQFAMSARQLVQMFGKDKVSQNVKTAYDGNQGGNLFEVIHVIEPSQMFDPSKQDYRGKKFSSLYFEVACEDQMKFLRQGGYLGLPFAAGRWQVQGTNVNGDGPGIEALGDVKMLQKMEEDKLQGLDKMVKPPMTAPLSMKGKGGTIISGGVTYVDVSAGQQGFQPAYQVKPDLQDIAFEIDRVERRIRKFFFNDLFLMIANDDKPMTATEVAKRYEEKIMMLGPVLERLQAEFLDTIVDRCYSIADNLGIIPIAPKELQGTELKIEYTGLLAQAQRMVASQSVRETAAFVGELSKVDPNVRDKFDFDQAVDEFADANGCPPRLIVPDDQVAEKRAVREKQQAQLQAAAQAAAAAKAAKDASGAKLGEGSVLDKMAERAGVA